MQGKTTFILTDRDTGRVVDKREEKNMVTDFMKDVFNMPRFALIGGNVNNGLERMIPMYNYLLHGLVLFDCNVPEKKDDYMIDGRYNMVATAGGVYSGTDTGRGTFNQNLSGETENGYRFVWDFSPERAVGTIRCASLTSLQNGDRGGIIANAMDLANNSGNRAQAVAGSVQMNFLMYRNKYYYYFSTSASYRTATIQRYSMVDPDSIGIKSTRSLKFEEEYTLSLPYFPTTLFTNVYEGRLYLSQVSYSSGALGVNTQYIDIDTGELVQLTPSIVRTPVTNSNYTYARCAIFNNQIYFGFNSVVYVIELDGTLVRTIPLSTSSLNAFMAKDNQLYVSGVAWGGNYIILLDGDRAVYFPNVSTFANFEISEHEEVKYPYIAVRSGMYLYMMMRTDYMATINNLSEPLEKTDRHALQVQYEITDG